MSEKSNIQYFHCYATANDNSLYFEDIKNLINIRNNCSGAKKVELYIAISKVKKQDFLDKLFVNTIKKMFAQHSTIVLKDIFFKKNTGRDFSSYSYLNKKIQAIASPNDYVFFQNRSACGPFRKNWFEEFLIQYEKFNSVALCGSTINFKDHPSIGEKNDLPHIQSYAFLTKVKFLKMLGNSFPGENETQRLKIIREGEIGMSQVFLERGYGITCMEWKEELITLNSAPLSKTDCKATVVANHQFYHRKYFKKNKNAKIKNSLWKPLLSYVKFIF